MIPGRRLGIGILDRFQSSRVAGKVIAGIIVHIEAIAGKLLRTQESDGQGLVGFSAQHIVVDRDHQIAQVQFLPICICQLGRSCKLNIQNAPQLHLACDGGICNDSAAARLLQYIVFATQPGLQLGGDHLSCYRLSILTLQFILRHLRKLHLDRQGQLIIAVYSAPLHRKAGAVG